MGVSTSTYVARTRRARKRRRSSSGSANAAVLPEPVTALPQMSRPASASGMQAACARLGRQGQRGIALWLARAARHAHRGSEPAHANVEAAMKQWTASVHCTWLSICLPSAHAPHHCCGPNAFGRKAWLSGLSAAALGPKLPYVNPWGVRKGQSDVGHSQEAAEGESLHSSRAATEHPVTEKHATDTTARTLGMTCTPHALAPWACDKLQPPPL